MWFDGIFQNVLAQPHDSEERSPILKLLPILIFVGLSLLSKLAKARTKKPKTPGQVSAPPSVRQPSSMQSPPAGPVRKPLPPYAQRANLPYAVKTPPPTQSGTREVRPSPRPAAAVSRVPAPSPRPATPSRTQMPPQKPVSVSRPAVSRPAPSASPALRPVEQSRTISIPPSISQEIPPPNKHPERQVRGEQPKSVTQKSSASAAGPLPAAGPAWVPNFSQPQALVQAVIYSEILGKPIGLRSALCDEF